MFCPKCGTQNDDTASFCKNCGNVLSENAANENQSQQPTQQPVAPAKYDNSKIYKILSYIGILWLIGLFVNPEKNDPKVKFHVGQGIILSIAGVALNIVGKVLNAIIKTIFTVSHNVYSFTYTTVSPFGAVLSDLVWLAISGCLIALAVIGIVNAVKDRENPLPVIGKFAFYK